MKEKAANHPSGNLTVEEEEVLPEEEAEMEEEEATQHQEAHWVEETHSPPGPTCPLTYDPSPMPTMQSQWENSPTSLTETEPRQKHSSTNSTTISYSTSMSRGLTPPSKRSP